MTLPTRCRHSALAGCRWDVKYPLAKTAADATQNRYKYLDMGKGAGYKVRTWSCPRVGRVHAFSADAAIDERAVTEFPPADGLRLPAPPNAVGSPPNDRRR
jgi:hypothetical protein